METTSVQVKGMHCASCAQIITKKLKKVDGVDSINVNLATEKAVVSYDSTITSISKMNDTLRNLGYSFETDSVTVQNEHQHDKKDDQLNRVYFSLPLTIFVFVLIMWDIAAQIFPSIPNLPIPMAFFNVIMFVLASIMLFWVGKPYLDGILRFINTRVANMDTLVGIGTLTAYIYSTIILLFPQIATTLGLPTHTYFDVTIVVIGFITLGKYLESRSKARTGEAIKKLLKLQAKTAIVIRNGIEIEIPISEVIVNDTVLIKAGTKIPVDGIIIEGSTSIDESMITGEPIPQDKKLNDKVIGGTINKQGAITIKALHVGSDTMLSQIIDLVEKAQGSKAKIQSLADKISSIFVPTVLVIAIVSFVLWITVGSYYLGFSLALSYGLLSFVGVLVIACPCALGLATPTAIIVGVGKGAENGILVKDAESLEKLYKTNTLAFDKTGTITDGTPSVTTFTSLDKKYTDIDILKYAASVEKFSQHPLAYAITQKAKELAIEFATVENFTEIEGIGVEGFIRNEKVKIKKPETNEESISEIQKLQNEGKTLIIIEINNDIAGFIAISDSIKKNAPETIRKIHKLGIQTVMVTGDNDFAAKFITQSVGINKFEARVMPQDKAKIIEKLQQSNNIVAMVGDGINDAPALTQADVGIAMATGTDVAIEAANITLLHGDISKTLQAIKLSKVTVRTIKQNLFWAFIYNIIGIPIAAGLLYPMFGILLNPVFAGLAMALSSVSVVGNSLLLKRVKL